jgi:hypothetical protein
MTTTVGEGNKVGSGAWVEVARGVGVGKGVPVGAGGGVAVGETKTSIICRLQAEVISDTIKTALIMSNVLFIILSYQGIVYFG